MTSRAAATMLIGVLATACASCGLVLDTAPPPTSPTSTTEFVGGGGGLRPRVTAPSTTTPASTTTPTPVTSPSLEDLEAIIGRSELPLCDLADEVGYSGAAILSAGSSATTRNDQLTTAEQASALAELDGFILQGRQLVALLVAEGSAPDERNFLDALSILEQRRRAEPADGDARATFSTFLSEQGALLEPVLRSLVERCPTGVIAALLNPGIGTP